MCVQIKDSITVKGRQYSLYTTPLDSCWTRRNPKPETRLTRSTCWRGYVASWEISDNSLYLIDILYHTPFGDRGLEYIFPKNDKKIKADWFIGELRIPIGNDLHTVFMWDTVYDYDWFLNIKKGNLINQYHKANY